MVTAALGTEFAFEVGAKSLFKLCWFLLLRKNTLPHLTALPLRLLLVFQCLALCHMAASSCKENSGKAENKKEIWDNCGVSLWITIPPLGNYGVVTVISWPCNLEPRPGPRWMPCLGWWLNNQLNLLWFIFSLSWTFLYILELHQSFSKVCIKMILLLSNHVDSSHIY